MRKAISWWRSIPRPVRIVRNLLLAAVLLCLFYLFRDCPNLTVEQAYRRAAERELVEPGEMLGMVQAEKSSLLDGTIFDFDYIVVAENSEGVILYGYRENDIGFFSKAGATHGKFSYREKSEQVTLMAAPTSFVIQEENQYIELPVILFDECPKAVRAELDLYLNAENDSIEETYEYHLDARREQSGFFEFRIMVGDGKNEIGKEAYALETLCDLFDDWGNQRTAAYPAVVRLYDQRNELIYERELTLQSLAAAAHAE